MYSTRATPIKEHLLLNLVMMFFIPRFGVLMSSSSSSDDHLCSFQRPLDQNAQHSASGGRSFSSWPTLLGGKPLQVNVSHSQGQLQCDKSVGPASSWVPDLRQAPPPLSVPPDHLGGFEWAPSSTCSGTHSGFSGLAAVSLFFRSSPCPAIVCKNYADSAFEASAACGGGVRGP